MKQKENPMGRKAKIETDILIQLANKFFTEECARNPKMLKIPKFGEYIRQHGYDVEDYLLRRNEQLRSHLATLQSNQESDLYQNLITFRNLDVDAFILKNTTPDAMKRSLIALDLSYQKAISSAMHFTEKYKNLEEEYTALSKKYGTLKTSYEDCQQQLDTEKATHKELEVQLSKYKAIIENYVYPEIANELLKKDGLIKDTAHIVNQDIVQQTLITGDTDIQNVSQSKNGVLLHLNERIQKKKHEK